MNFSHSKLKSARAIKGYSIEEVATRIGIDTHAYWRIESGKTQLKVTQFVKIANVLGQPLTYFIEDDELNTEIHDRIKDLELILNRVDPSERANYDKLIRSLLLA